jgi:RNA polymerase sigma-70 factor (ECF subfamily)
MIRPDFESIVREHQSMVYSIAYNFFSDVAVAEEVAQDVFLQLYQNQNVLKSPLHLRRWLRRTATHRSIDLARRRQRRPEVQVDQLPEVPVAANATDPLMRDRLRRLVGSLPETPRSVVILRYGEDMDVHEISDALEIPVPTVWSHLRRSIALLREKFESADHQVGAKEHHERVRTETS